MRTRQAILAPVGRRARVRSAECGVRSAGVRECGSAGVRECGSAGVRECGVVRSGWMWCEGHAPSARLCSHLPQNCWGRLGCGREAGAGRRGSNWRPRGPLPRPLPARASIRSCWESLCRLSPLPLAGEGAALRPRVRAADASSNPFVAPQSVGIPNLPQQFCQQFWGRWASNASPEGAPRTQGDACRSPRNSAGFSPPPRAFRGGRAPVDQSPAKG
jgi:hypothetical protein